MEIELDLGDLLEMADPQALLDGILALVAEHRDTAMTKHHFTPEAAEEMAVALHSVIATRVMIGGMATVEG